MTIKGIRGTPLLRLAALALAATLTGCVKVEQTLTLNDDGSGVIDITYGMSEEAVTGMAETAKSMMEETNSSDSATMPFDFSDEDIRQDFKDYEASGVVLESVSSEVREGWKYRHLVIRFRDLGGLAQTGFIADRDFSLSKDAGGNYVLVQSTAGNGNVSDQLSALGGAEMEEVMNTVMQGFRAVLRVKTPGKILETNAPEKSDRSATWTFDLEKDPDALEKVQQASMRIVFEGKGLKIPEFKSASANH